MSEPLQHAYFNATPGPLPVPMAHSDGTALPLLLLGSFGADLIRFGPGKGVGTHTHPGAHMLFVTRGWGTLVYDGQRHTLSPGMCYYVPGGVPHSIRAYDDNELDLISVAIDHRPAGSSERLETCNGKE